MRERITHAIQTTDLAWDPDKEKDIDVLTAVGLTDLVGRVNMLGGLLLALRGAPVSKTDFYVPGQDRYQADQRAAVQLLTEVSRFHKAVKRLTAEVRERLAGIAVTEWLHEQCGLCHGAGSRQNEAAVIVECGECKGSGRRRFTDDERMAVIFESELRALTQCKDQALQKELKCDLEREYHRRYERALVVLHGYLGLAQRDKARTVGIMLDRW